MDMKYSFCLFVPLSIERLVYGMRAGAKAPRLSTPHVTLYSLHFDGDPMDIGALVPRLPREGFRFDHLSWERFDKGAIVSTLTLPERARLLHDAIYSATHAPFLNARLDDSRFGARWRPHLTVGYGAPGTPLPVRPLPSFAPRCIALASCPEGADGYTVLQSIFLRAAS